MKSDNFLNCCAPATYPYKNLDFIHFIINNKQYSLDLNKVVQFSFSPTNKSYLMLNAFPSIDSLINTMKKESFTIITRVSSDLGDMIAFTCDAELGETRWNFDGNEVVLTMELYCGCCKTSVEDAVTEKEQYLIEI